MRTRRSQSSSNPVPQGHRTVLLHEAVAGLALAPGQTAVDFTLGGAGHARAIAAALGPTGTFIGFDADREGIERAEAALSARDARIVLVNANFRDAERELADRGITTINAALFDLGWSSYQLSAGRGFSFQADEALSMAYDAGQALTARTIINEWEESSLVDVIRGWGEERYAQRIAHAIVEARDMGPIETARQLAEIVRAAVPASYRRGKLHPATKTFQALRIAVNDELGALADGLKGAWNVLAPGGRIAVISFHSIEDRLVKQTFRAWEDEGTGVRITKKPITPSESEIAENPRARSAKLRIVQKNI